MKNLPRVVYDKVDSSIEDIQGIVFNRGLLNIDISCCN